jgi:hypothetical protein
MRTDQRHPSTFNLPSTHSGPAFRRATYLLLPAVLPVFSLFHSAVYCQFHSPLILSCAQSGDEGIRTPGLRRAKAALSHLSYIPKLFIFGVVGLTGFEPVTPALSAQCSNHLSYRPLLAWPQQLRSDRKHYVTEMLATPCETLILASRLASGIGVEHCLDREDQTSLRSPRKEVIQAHLPVHLPCYDFVPVTSPTFDSSCPCGLGYRLQVLPAPMT